MVRPGVLFSGSALLGLLSLPFLGGECSWVATQQRSLTPSPLRASAEPEGTSGWFFLFEDEPDPTSLLLRQGQLRERVEQLEQRAQAHQWAAQELDRGGIPHPFLSQLPVPAIDSEELRQLTQRIAQEPGNAQLYLQRAQYLWHQLQADPLALPGPEQAAVMAHLTSAALRDLDIAIVLDPYLAEAYLLKAKLQHEFLQDPDQALATLSPIGQIAYRNPQLHLMRSRIWAEQGHLESAFDVSHLAIELAQQNQNAADLFDAYVHRGLLWASICDFSLAAQDFSRAIELKPDQGDVYYYRGMARVYQGVDRAGAVSDLSHALMLWRASGTGSPELLEHAEAVRLELLR